MKSATPEQLVRIAIATAKPYVKKGLLSKVILERDAAVQELVGLIMESIEAQYELVEKPDKPLGGSLHH